jgi:hypothetical protein
MFLRNAGIDQHIAKSQKIKNKHIVLIYLKLVLFIYLITNLFLVRLTTPSHNSDYTASSERMIGK